MRFHGGVSKFKGVVDNKQSVFHGRRAGDRISGGWLREFNSIKISILQMRKPRCREGK